MFSILEQSDHYAFDWSQAWMKGPRSQAWMKSSHLVQVMNNLTCLSQDQDFDPGEMNADTKTCNLRPPFQGTVGCLEREYQVQPQLYLQPILMLICCDCRGAGQMCAKEHLMGCKLDKYRMNHQDFFHTSHYKNKIK